MALAQSRFSASGIFKKRYCLFNRMNMFLLVLFGFRRFDYQSNRVLFGFSKDRSAVENTGNE
jgi:hypothetical protein